MQVAPGQRQRLRHGAEMVVVVVLPPAAARRVAEGGPARAAGGPVAVVSAVRGLWDPVEAPAAEDVVSPACASIYQL